MAENSPAVGLYTLGCKVAQYETEAIAEDFERHGFRVLPFDEICDVYVVNTCTVTAESDRKCRQVIRRARHTNPAAHILVCGCYAQTSPDEVAAIEGVSYVGGTDRKMKLAEEALALLAAPPAAPRITTAPLTPEFEAMSVTRAPRTRAYIKIEDGCECRCTYCAIPGARGPVRSKPADAVLAEIATLAAGGSREIVLTGIETASWGVDLGKERLIDLLERIDKIENVPRIRLGSLSPECIRPDFAERFARLSCTVPHLHLSMQSGSDSVLRGMRRRYNASQAEEALALLRRLIPRIQFTTDMMVGFPGESEENFRETLEFTRRARFLDMHIFAYSRRPGTPAADYPDQIPAETKRRRSAELTKLRDCIRDEVLAEVCAMGEPLPVIVETVENGIAVGHSDSFIETRFSTDEDFSGKEVKLLPVRPQEGYIVCKKI